MNLTHLLKVFGISTTLSVAAVLSFSSCNSFIFDNEGDCTLHYRLKFRYDMNLKWADAFNSEVRSVRVYAFDRNEAFVREYVVNTGLSDPNFAIDLDLDPGVYHLVAWCGIDNEGVTRQSFSAPQATSLRLKDLDCQLNCNLSKAPNQAVSDQHLQFMYWGELDIEILQSDEFGGYRYFTMPLIKDTNHLRVNLVQLSGENTDVEDFTYSIEATNGVMNYENKLTGDMTITYLPWNLQNAVADVETGYTNGVITTQTAIADLDLSRFTTGQSESMKLTIRNTNNNEVVASIPVIQYALLAKEYYEFAYAHEMTDQEFLDREDEYEMTFFLDRNLRWISSFIYINSWRIVLNGYELN